MKYDGATYDSDTRRVIVEERRREVTKTSVRVPRYALARFDGMECVAVWPYGKHLFRCVCRMSGSSSSPANSMKRCLP